MKKSWLLSILLLLPFAPRAAAQELLTINEACSYYGEAIDDAVYGFASDQDAEAAVGRIVDHTGLPKNFKILAANVPNAAADISADGDRLILYNQTFMKRITEATHTDWAAVSILAHEIGHHLSGHTLKKGGSRPEIELQADSFSGYVLYKMGAALTEAQAAMEAFAQEVQSDTHPPKSARLAAIANGWTRAKDQDRGQRGGESPASAAGDENRGSQQGGPGGQQPTDVDEEPGLDAPTNNTAFLAQCSFFDGSVVFVNQQNQLLANFQNNMVPVGSRRPSSYPNVVYELYLHSEDPTVAALLVSLGVYNLTYYVDQLGQIWRTDWGTPFQLGQCQ